MKRGIYVRREDGNHYRICGNFRYNDIADLIEDLPEEAFDGKWCIEEYHGEDSEGRAMWGNISLDHFI